MSRISIQSFCAVWSQACSPCLTGFRGNERSRYRCLANYPTVVMNSVSPTAAQYLGGSMQDEGLAPRPERRRTPSWEPRGHFGHGAGSEASRESPGEPDEVDRLKAKLMSAWNNVKYGECENASVCLCTWCIHRPLLSHCV